MFHAEELPSFAARAERTVGGCFQVAVGRFGALSPGCAEAFWSRRNLWNGFEESDREDGVGLSSAFKTPRQIGSASAHPTSHNRQAEQTETFLPDRLISPPPSHSAALCQWKLSQQAREEKK